MAPFSAALAILRTNGGVRRCLFPAEYAVRFILLRFLANHDDDLAFDIQSGVVVVFLFLGGNTVAREHDRTFSLASSADRQALEILFQFECHGSRWLTVGPWGRHEHQRIPLDRTAINRRGDGEFLERLAFENIRLQARLLNSSAMY